MAREISGRSTQQKTGLQKQKLEQNVNEVVGFGVVNWGIDLLKMTTNQYDLIVGTLGYVYHYADLESY